MPADGPVPLGARLDAAVVPAADDPLSLQQAQVGLELVPEGFVLFEYEKKSGTGAAGRSGEGMGRSLVGFVKTRTALRSLGSSEN